MSDIAQRPAPQFPASNPSPPARALRPIGSAEHMFWLLNQHSPAHFAVYAHVEGATTVAAWRQAVDSLQQRHPNFSVRIVPDETGRPCFEPVPSPRIPLRVNTAPDAQWEAELEREMGTRFDAGVAPMLRAVLLHQPDRSVFILSAHHSIADGMSLVFAIRDTLQALAGETLDPNPPVHSMDSWFASYSGPFATSQPDQGATRPVPARVFRHHDGAAWPKIRRIKLTPQMTETLRRRSRSEGASVQSALITAAVAAARHASKTLENAAIRVSCPIDFRRVIGAGEEVGPFGAGVGVPMAPHTHATFWEAARFANSIIQPARVPAALASQLAMLVPVMASRPSIEDVVGIWRGDLGFDINVSNLGALPFDTRLGDLTITELCGPSILIGFVGEQAIGVGTANGVLSLLHTSYEPLPALLEVMEERLIAACA